MAYVYDNKTYRNLQQQVKENMDDIARLQSLKLVGLDVSYIVDTEEDLADITAEQGMVVAVGTEQPYKLFVYNDSSWVDFGEFPKAGPRGEQGPQGQVGNPGPRGLTGEPGPRGYTGAAGPAGQPGPQGQRGAQGPKGDKGDPGLVDAFVADAESITAVGQAYVDEDGYLQVCTSLSPLTFEQGGSVKGPKGDTGEQGPQGIQGEQGAQGPTGATGPQGARGPQGEQGIRGPQGEQGIQGPQGPTGATGPEGPQGPKGPEGPQGPKGDTGAQGPKGDPGLTASVEVNGQVYTTDATGKITLPDYPDEVAWGNIQGTLSNQTDLQSALNAKQDVISDLATIRSGAAAGATAVQPAAIANMVTTNGSQTISGAKTITGTTTFGDTLGMTVNGSAFNLFGAGNPNNFKFNLDVHKSNDEFVVYDYDDENELFTVKAGLANGNSYTWVDTDNFLWNNKTVATTDQIPTNYVTTNTAQTITGNKLFNSKIIANAYPFELNVAKDDASWPIYENNQDYDAIYYSNGIEIKDENGYDTNTYKLAYPKASGTLALTSDIPTTMAWTDITGKPTFATVATSGSYNDLSDKPTIPTNYVTTDTDQTISGEKKFIYPLKINAGSNNNNGLIFTRTDSSTGVVSEDIKITSYGTSIDNSKELTIIERTNNTGIELFYRFKVDATTGNYEQGWLSPTLTGQGAYIADLGHYASGSDKRWKNLYLSGNLSDGTNSIAVANIASKTDVSTAIAGQTKETWTFTLSDNTTVTKTVVLG